MANDVPVSGAPPRGRWALPTMGGSKRADARRGDPTGTHGDDFNLLPADPGHGARVSSSVAPDGQLHWIQREGDSALTDWARWSACPPPLAGGQRSHDDLWFCAVLVSLPAMGVIYSYIIEVRGQFGLSEKVHETTWLDVRASLALRPVPHAPPTTRRAIRGAAGSTPTRPRRIDSPRACRCFCHRTRRATHPARRALRTAASSSSPRPSRHSSRVGMSQGETPRL